MKKLMIITLSYLIIASGFAFAKGRPDTSGLRLPPGKWWQNPKVAEKLDLTVKEQEELDAFFVESKRRMLDLRSEAGKEKFELEVILDKPDFDEAAFSQHFEKFQKMQTHVVKERGEIVAQVRKLLGRDRFRVLRLEIRHRGKNRRHGQAEQHPVHQK